MLTFIYKQIYIFLVISFCSEVESDIFFTTFWNIIIVKLKEGFPGGTDGKESAYTVGEPGSISGLRRSPGKGKDNPLQYSGLENPMDRGAWKATVHGVPKN